MCGRFNLQIDDAEQLLVELAPEEGEHLVHNLHEVVPPDFGGHNIQPGRAVPIVTYHSATSSQAHTFEVKLAKWGLIPSRTSPHTKPNHFAMFNARDDRLREVHARLLQANRCLLMVSGFFEWQHLPKSVKQPYFISRAGEAEASKTHGLFLGGIWDTWQRDDGSILMTFSVVTVDPAKNLAWLHDRSPLILSAPDALEWISNPKFDQVQRLIAPPTLPLRWWPVTKDMGKIQFQSPACSKPVDLRQSTKPITSYFRQGSGKEDGETADPVVVSEDDDDSSHASSKSSKRPKLC